MYVYTSFIFTTIMELKYDNITPSSVSRSVDNLTFDKQYRISEFDLPKQSVNVNINIIVTEQLKERPIRLCYSYLLFTDSHS